MKSKPERIYCTYFDHAYEARGHLMASSLRAAGDHAPLLVVCFDNESLAQTETWGIDDVIAVGVSEIEQRFPALLKRKAERTPAEYFFTCTPWITAWALTLTAEGGWATYLDADLMFASNPEPVFDELAHSSVGIIAHRFNPGLEELTRFGTYNVGWVSFRADERGRAVLEWWGERCLEWCRDRAIDGRFADQGYLDSFADVAEGVHVIGHPGADVAPWNIGSNTITHTETNSVLVDEQPLLFFHMHGIRRVDQRYVCRVSIYHTAANDTVRELILTPYVIDLAAAEAARPATKSAKRGMRGFRGFRSRQSIRRAERHLVAGDLSWPANVSRDDTPTSPTP